MYYLKKLYFYCILLLYYYINLRPSIIFCVSSGDIIYYSLGISLSCSIFSVSFKTFFDLFCGDGLGDFLILSIIYLPIKLLVA